MESKRKAGSFSSSSSSSFTADLFGTKEPQPASSAGIFASIFPPPHTSSFSSFSWQGGAPQALMGLDHGKSSLLGIKLGATSRVLQFKKDGGEDDGNGNNSPGASRGNWWQGSLYY
ncbi:uncharacterized protein LOC110812148 isoform X3 [Carica papaya]|uniref:uncharacterized protein LOC110812148 isoform X3 n=1 Tax=Carica papaya TaxID=3649 RepID=UPI000B8CEC83|nr:uncharacterized protein LOC110812148 isoform X3 [Carica papaya]